MSISIQSSVRGIFKALISAFLCFAIVLSSPLINAANVVDVRVNQGDTIWTIVPSEFEIWIENDVDLGGISIGFEVWSPDGALWEWRYAYSSLMGGLSLGTAKYGSRLGDPLNPFDNPNTVFIEHNVDGIGRDTIGFHGESQSGHLVAGPLEHMLSFHFSSGGPIDDEIRTLCTDSCFIPPSIDFVFVDVNGSPFSPAVTWGPEEDRCWPVKEFPHTCGDANGNGGVDVGDAVLIINYMFKCGAIPADPICQSDANHDGNINVGDAVYLIQNIFRGGPNPIEPCCPEIGYNPPSRRCK
jgi:hypothetical protein